MGRTEEGEVGTYNPPLFRDRAEAGRRLAERVAEREPTDPVVLAVPAGGVPVGVEVARRLVAPLDLTIVRKIRIPWEPEAGFGAVTSDGEVLLNPRLAPALGLGEEELRRLVETARDEVAVRERTLREGRPPAELGGRAVILVDDGLASGYTMLAAVRSARHHGPREVLVAVPTASGGAVKLLQPEVDGVVALYVHPAGMPFAVASSYERWHDLTDGEVLALLGEARG